MKDLEKIIKKAQEGDKDAFGEIYKRFYKKIYRYCMFNTENEKIAQDICQESFVKAWKSMKNFKTNDKNWSIQAYLFKIARNLIIDASRKKKEVSIDKYEYLKSSENLYENLERKQDLEKIRFALKKLSEEEKQIIILRYFEDMDTKEIAKIVNIKDGALRVRIHRVLAKLKDIVEIYDRKSN